MCIFVSADAPVCTTAFMWTSEDDSGTSFSLLLRQGLVSVSAVGAPSHRISHGFLGLWACSANACTCGASLLTTQQPFINSNVFVLFFGFFKQSENITFCYSSTSISRHSFYFFSIYIIRDTCSNILSNYIL